MSDKENTSEQVRRDERVEQLAREFHSVYQAEAKRQGDVRHHDDYDALPENIKEFDRVLARHVLAELEQAERENAKLLRERDDYVRAVDEEWKRAEDAEARAAAVPALAADDQAQAMTDRELGERLLNGRWTTIEIHEAGRRLVAREQAQEQR